jgi:hypothetical protein
VLMLENGRVNDGPDHAEDAQIEAGLPATR